MYWTYSLVKNKTRKCMKERNYRKVNKTFLSLCLYHIELDMKTFLREKQAMTKQITAKMESSYRH